MKLSNDIVVIDLETTAGQDENGYQTNNDIIQIGAVILDRSLNPIAEFDSLVKPREPVSQFITDLTGITNAEAQMAPEFPDVFGRLEALIRAKVANVKHVRFSAWGTYFDIPIMRRLYQEYRLGYPFSGTAIDAKTLAFAWMSLSGHRTDKLSVQHVANVMGIKPTGNYHSAIVDARAEGAILRRAMTDLDSGTFVDGQLIKLKKEGSII